MLSRSPTAADMGHIKCSQLLPLWTLDRNTPAHTFFLLHFINKVPGVFVTPCHLPMASEWDPYVSFQKYVRDSANYLSIITLHVSSIESSNVQKKSGSNVARDSKES